MPQRSITTGIGVITINQPLVDYRFLDTMNEKGKLSSSILPRYIWIVPSINNQITCLYLEDIYTGDPHYRIR